MNSTNESKYIYGGKYFDYLYDLYSPIHMPLSACICGFGMMSNALNVVVLRQKSMRSPTNILLTGLSIAQLCLVINYLFLLTYNFSASTCFWPSLHNYAFVFYKWINVNLNVVFHSIATCHTLTISVVRFLAINAPTYCRTRINLRWSKKVVIIIYSILPIFCLPMFFMSSVVESFTSKGKCGLDVVYELEYTDNVHLIEAVMWLFGVVFKLGPSLAIAVLSLFLIKSLRAFHRGRSRMTPKNSLVDTATETLISSPPPTPEHNRLRKNADRKQPTKMLMTVALLCVSVELPHGIINLLTAIFGQQFAKEVYDNLGDIFEMLTILYSSVNFLLYCLISVEYQKALVSLILSCPMKLAKIKKPKANPVFV